MKLSKYLKDSGYDLIESPIRNHKPLQLWLKQIFNEVELYYADINHAFMSDTQLIAVEDFALSVDSTKQDEYNFNIGISLLDTVLKSLGLGAFDLSGKIKSGKKVTISYNNSVTKVIPLGDLTDYLSNADFKHPNPVLLKNANNNNILIITGVVFAQNLVVDIDTDFNLDANFLTDLTNSAEGKLDFSSNSQQHIKMVSNGSGSFPIAVKASRLHFSKGVFTGLNLVTDNRNFF